MMQLLDIALPGEEYRRPRRILNFDDPDTLIDLPSTDTVNVDTVTATDSLSTPDNVIDTLQAGIQQFGDFGTGSGSSSTTMWAIAAVLVALGLCFYFVRRYRQSLQG
ncbi:MAG: hypothetical protein IJR02_01570 [Bacteroidaceae bacterium]|jgi:hypothetical protein|nr:hypothetical protein [Bacteroidaceae bacterium]